MAVVVVEDVAPDPQRRRGVGGGLHRRDRTDLVADVVGNKEHGVAKLLGPPGLGSPVRGARCGRRSQAEPERTSHVATLAIGAGSEIGHAETRLVRRQRPELASENAPEGVSGQRLSRNRARPRRKASRAAECPALPAAIAASFLLPPDQRVDASRLTASRLPS
jgi:hypothetical protein